ncbi:unnamed protein product [Pedinophyceae sp. YPF-701]|nr:unnamed protein product [Pedinophyceae sp. YPF-701]
MSRAGLLVIAALVIAALLGSCSGLQSIPKPTDRIRRTLEARDGAPIARVVASQGCRFRSMTRLYRWARFEVGEGFWPGVDLHYLGDSEEEEEWEAGMDDRHVRLRIEHKGHGRLLVDEDLRAISVHEAREILKSHGFRFQDPKDAIRSPEEYDHRYKLDSHHIDDEATFLLQEEQQGWERSIHEKDACHGPETNAVDESEGGVQEQGGLFSHRDADEGGEDRFPGHWEL